MITLTRIENSTKLTENGLLEAIAKAFDAASPLIVGNWYSCTAVIHKNEDGTYNSYEVKMQRIPE